MSEELSTSPGLASPVPSDDTTWLKRYGDIVVPIRLKSGAVVPIPMLFWGAQALVLHGVADASAVEGLIRHQGLRARQVNRENLLETQPRSGKVWVQVWAPDYGGTTVGPIKAVFAWIVVEQRRDCVDLHPNLPHTWWWWYYGNSVVNREFKRDVWGIPNELGIIETSYLGDTKVVRMLEKGRIVLKLRLARRHRPEWTIVKTGRPENFWDESEVARRLAASSEKLKQADKIGEGPFRSVTVSHRAHDNGENEVELLGAKISGDRKDGTMSFNEGDDEFCCQKGTAVEMRLADVGFERVAWDFYAGYNGIVKIYDEKGGGTPMDGDVGWGNRLIDLFKLKREEEWATLIAGLGDRRSRRWFGEARIKSRSAWTTAMGSTAVDRVLAEQLVDALEQALSSRPGFRITHAKGIVCTGRFTPSREAGRLCRAGHFQQPVEVAVRFSDFGGVPNIADKDAPTRGMAIRFHLANGAYTDIVAHSYDGFPVATPEEFLDYVRLVSKGPNSPNLHRFLVDHPKARQFFEAHNPVPKSFATESFYGVHAFRFVNDEGRERYGRYAILPVEGPAYLSSDEVDKKPADFLFKELRSRFEGGQPVEFRLTLQLADGRDAVDDPSLPWPSNRGTEQLGIIALDAEASQGQECELAFDPTHLTDGVEASDDSILAIRGVAYAIAAARRRGVSPPISVRSPQT